MEVVNSLQMKDHFSKDVADCPYIGSSINRMSYRL